MIIVAIILFVLTIVTLINFDRINCLQKESENAELRAVTHFRKLNKIENILVEADNNKTPAVFTVDKIKAVILNQDK